MGRTSFPAGRPRSDQFTRRLVTFSSPRLKTATANAPPSSSRAYSWTGSLALPFFSTPCLPSGSWFTAEASSSHRTVRRDKRARCTGSFRPLGDQNPDRHSKQYRFPIQNTSVATENHSRAAELTDHLWVEQDRFELVRPAVKRRVVDSVVPHERSVLRAADVCAEQQGRGQHYSAQGLFIFV